MNISLKLNWNLKNRFGANYIGLICRNRDRTDFDKGANNRPFEKVGPILSNDDRNKNKTNAGENQCRDSIARKRLIEKTKTENGSNGTDARIRGKEYYSTKNGVIYTIYLKRLRAGRKNAVFL